MREKNGKKSVQGLEDDTSPHCAHHAQETTLLIKVFGSQDWDRDRGRDRPEAPPVSVFCLSCTFAPSFTHLPPSLHTAGTICPGYHVLMLFRHPAYDGSSLSQRMELSLSGLLINAPLPLSTAAGGG